MPTITYVPIASKTLTTSAASVTFSGISQTYRDLVLVGQGTNASASGINIRFNSDSGANYSSVVAYGDGGSTASSSTSGQTAFQIGRFDLNLADLKVDIMDYSATDKHKTVINRYNASSVLTAMRAARWASTSAITSFALTLDAGSFSPGSTFSLYGIHA